MAVARNGGHCDGPHHFIAAEPDGDRVARAELVVALRVGLERAVHVDVALAGSREEQAESEGILEWIDGEPFGPQPGKELRVVGRDAQLPQPRAEHVHDIRFGA